MCPNFGMDTPQPALFERWWSKCLRGKQRDLSRDTRPPRSSKQSSAGRSSVRRLENMFTCAPNGKLFVAPGFSPACAALKGGSTVNVFSERNTSEDCDDVVARASCPLGRGHPARAVAGAGRSRASGRDARATKGKPPSAAKTTNHGHPNDRARQIRRPIGTSCCRSAFPYVRRGKRLFDIAASLACLAIASPLLLLCALLVRLTSRGPVLFRQIRVGYHGRHFILIKFRTMFKGAEELGHP